MPLLLLLPPPPPAMVSSRTPLTPPPPPLNSLLSSPLYSPPPFGYPLGVHYDASPLSPSIYQLDSPGGYEEGREWVVVVVVVVVVASNQDVTIFLKSGHYQPYVPTTETYHYYHLLLKTCQAPLDELGVFTAVVVLLQFVHILLTPQNTGDALMDTLLVIIIIIIIITIIVSTDQTPSAINAMMPRHHNNSCNRAPLSPYHHPSSPPVN